MKVVYCSLLTGNSPVTDVEVNVGYDPLFGLPSIALRNPHSNRFLMVRPDQLRGIATELTKLADNLPGEHLPEIEGVAPAREMAA